MRNSTTRSLSCVGCLTLGPAGSALETAQAAANHLRGSLRQHCRRLPLVTICRTAGYALAAVRGSRKEVRVRDAHGHPGNGAVAANWIGDDLGGLPAFSPAARYREPRGPRRRGRLGRPAVSPGGTHLDSVHEQPGPEDCLNSQKVIGPFPSDALESIQIRQEESRRAAAVYGAQPEFLNLHETYFWLGRKEIYFYD